MSEIENCCGTTCDKEKLAEEITELKAKIAEQAVHIKELTNCLNDRKALCRQAFDANDAQAENIKQQAAQIEQLKAHNEMLMQASWEIKEGVPGAFYKIKNIRKTTPAQCLADVRADAVEEFTKYIDDTGELSFDDISFLADESEKFVNQLRQQAKGGN